MKLDLITTDKKFSPFFWVQALGALNDNVLKNALVIFILEASIVLYGIETKSLITLASGLFILPFVLFSPWAGQICDRFERSKLTRGIKIWELLIALVASCGFIIHNTHLLLASLFMMGVQSTFFGPIKYSVVPSLLSSNERLVEANAYLEMGTFVAILLGTLLGGAGIVAGHGTIVVSCILIGMALLGVFCSFLMPPIACADPNLKININPFPAYLKLWKITKQSSEIFYTVLSISWFWFFGASLLSLLPVLIKDFIGGSGELVTLFLAVFTLGIGVGSFLCEAFSRKRIEKGFIAIASLGLSVFLGDLYFALQSISSTGIELGIMSFLGFGWAAARVLFDFVMLSICGGFYIVPLYALIQAKSEAKTRSQLIAANNVMNALFMVIASLLIMGAYLLGFNVAQILLGLALLNLVIAFATYFSIPEHSFKIVARTMALFYNFKFEGEENYPEEGPCIIVCNHVSFIDWVFLMSSSHRPLRFVIYFTFVKIPFMKALFKQAGVIPIAETKENPNIIKRAFFMISEKLSEGQAVGLFPEGVITYDGEMNEIKKGILKMLEANPVPVVPARLDGLWGSVFSRHPQRKMRREFRRRVYLSIAPAIAPEDFDLERLAETMEGLKKNI